MADESPLLSERRGAVLRLTLNNPARRNGLTMAMADALAATLADAAQDSAVRAVVLAGAGKHFCSGADLSSALADVDPSPEGRRAAGRDGLAAHFHPALRALWELPKPVVAEHAGAAVGFGMSVVLACDVRVMAQDAYLASGFLKIGLFPDGGLLWQLERLLGWSRAMELILEPDRRLTAEEARAWGLAAKVVPPEELPAQAQALAERLAAGPPLVQRRAKQQLHRPEPTLREALAAELEPAGECLASDDAAEGIMAFFEKRPPAFKG